MNRIGMGELIIILVIAIVVLGPDKVPQLAQALGKGIRSMKKYIHETTKDLEEIQELKDLQKEVTDIQKDLKTMGQELEKSVKAETAAVEKELAATEKAITVPAETKETAEPAGPDTSAEKESIPEAETASQNSQEEINNG